MNEPQLQSPRVGNVVRLATETTVNEAALAQARALAPRIQALAARLDAIEGKLDRLLEILQTATRK